jgi:hypothetical protein
MNDGEQFRENSQIAGRIGQMALEWLWDKTRPFHLGTDAFEIVGDEEAAHLGYSREEQESIVLIRRKRDGKTFEVEIEPWVRPARTREPTAAEEAAALEAAGQLSLPGVLS